MYSSAPRKIDIRALRLEQACPASVLKGSTRKPRNALDRWVAVRDAIVQWHTEGTPSDVARIEDDLFGQFDAAQAELCARSFRAWRQQVGTEGTATFDPPRPTISAADGASYLEVPFQVELTHDDGSVEHIRIKTRHPSTDDEKAVVELGGDPEIDYNDMLLDPGQLDPVSMENDRARMIVDDLFELSAEPADSSPSHQPGFHCWTCRRVAACKRYPVLGEGRPTSRTRNVVLGKGTLARLVECPRRVAWKAIFQMPDPTADSGFDQESLSPALLMGNRFHEAIAVALLDADPDAVMARHTQVLEASEQADFALLWETHQDVMARPGHAMELTVTELPVGCTLPAAITDEVAAITLLGIVDAAGREADGTPAIIEHRTTASRPLPDLEQELYAVAGALATGVDRIAVHHHHLRADADVACTRRLFEPDDLAQATGLLAQAAVTIAEMDWVDATAAPFRIGTWCSYCPYAALCARHRAES